MPNVEFKDNSIAIKQEINEKSLNWLGDIARELETQVKQNSRNDTGETKRQWKHYIDKSEGKAYIGNELENALWEEFGTGEYAVNGDGRNTPWYVPVWKVTGKKKPTFNGKVEIVHIKGKSYYKTNGKKPKKALTKAFTRIKPLAKKRAEEIFGGLNK